MSLFEDVTELTFNVTSKKVIKPLFRPKVGDFIYGDKTWSTELDSTKNCVGVITDVRSKDFDFISLHHSDDLLKMGDIGSVFPGVDLFSDGELSSLDMSGKTTKLGGGKGQGYTTRDFGEPTGKRNAGGGGADRNRDGGMGGASDYTEGSGIGQGNRGSGGYGGGGCGSNGTGGDGTVLIRGKRYK